MKKSIFSGFMLAASVAASAQSLDKMQWFNEPVQLEIKNNSLTMSVTPQCDYWRISHYGFTVDDAPVAGLVSDHGAEIVYYIYKLNFRLDVVLVVDAQNES